MKNKYLVILCVIGVILTVACGKREVLNESIKNSVAEEMGFVKKTEKIISEDVFSSLSTKQQQSIKEIIENIEDYDENKVLPENIDKENFVVFNNWNSFVIEIGSGEDKVILSLTKNYEVEDNFIFQSMHLAKDSNTKNLPYFNEVDFLSDEQKQLYKNGIEILSGVYQTKSFINYAEAEEKEDGIIKIKVPGFDSPEEFVLVENDKFTNYKEFKDYVYSIFSKELWDEIEENSSTFINKDGQLYWKRGVRNGDITYMGKDSDKYELVSKTDDKIVFNNITHYSWVFYCDGFKPEWADIEKHKAVLEKIDGEWKFTELVLPW